MTYYIASALFWVFIFIVTSFLASALMALFAQSNTDNLHISMKKTKKINRKRRIKKTKIQH